MNSNSILLLLLNIPLWGYLLIVIFIADIYSLCSLKGFKNPVWNFRKLYNQDINLILSRIKFMDGSEFEDFIAYLFKLDGYEVQQTPKTNDKGTDIILNNSIYIECKHWDKKSLIGRELINKLVGSAYGLSGGNNFKTLFITTSSYNKNAIEFAKLTKTKLWDMNDVIRLIKHLNSTKILRYLNYNRDIWETKEINN